MKEFTNSKKKKYYLPSEFNPSKMKILLLMTTGMSLKKWEKLGQLSRELRIYSSLGKRIGEVVFYSYGYRENKIIKDRNSLGVISKKSRFWNGMVFPRFILKRINYLWNAINLVRYRKLFKSIDIIKTNQFTGAVWGTILKKIFRKKLIVRMGYYHTHIKKMPWRRVLIEKKCFSSADKILVTNKEAQKYICDKYDILPHKVRYHPNSIDTDLFSPMETNNKKYDLIFVGRLSRVKNLKELLKGITKSGIHPFRSIFIGSGPDKQYLIRLINRYKLKIEIIDKIENKILPKYYNMAKCFILPSLYEGNPKTLLESMSCGLPVIASNVPGNKEIVSHGINGYLCEPNSSSIAEALRVISGNEKLAQKLSMNARKYILKNNSLEVMIDKEIEIYKTLINSEKERSCTGV